MNALVTAIERVPKVAVGIGPIPVEGHLEGRIESRVTQDARARGRMVRQGSLPRAATERAGCAIVNQPGRDIRFCR